MPEAQETSDKSKETTPAVEKPKEAAQPPAKTAGEQDKGKTAEPAKAASDGKREPKRLTGDEEPDDGGEDEGLFTLSGAALRKRMARFTRRELREKFGTDDSEKIQAELAELKTLREEKDERRKEQLSKEERLTEERKAARRDADEAKTALRKLEDERDIGQVDNQFARLAAKHLDSDLVDDDDWRSALFSKLRKHLIEETGGDAKKITDKVVEKFFGEYAKQKPQFARRSAGQPAVEVEIESGSKAPAAPPGNGAPPGQAGAKTARPGQPNSMTAAEIRQAGYKW